MRKNRIEIALTCVALMACGTLVFPGPASAAERERGQRVDVTLVGDGSTADINASALRPGAVDVVFTGSSTAGTSSSIVSFRHQVSLTRLLSDLTTAASPTAPPTDAAAAINDVNQIVTVYGGGDTTPSESVTNEIRLSHPGRYFVINHNAHGVAVSLGSFEVTGHRVRQHHVHPQARVTLGHLDRHVILTQGTLPRQGTILIHNGGDAIHLLRVNQIADGVTDAQVQAEYDQILDGQTPTSDPAGLFSTPHVLFGSDAMSAGRSSLLTYSVPAGTYLLQCFVPDGTTGIPNTLTGMHAVVVIP